MGQALHQALEHKLNALVQSGHLDQAFWHSMDITDEQLEIFARIFLEQRSQLKFNLPVQALRFGDGQHQHITLVWARPNWTGSCAGQADLEQVKKLDQFFKDHKGITAFGWTPPDAMGQAVYLQPMANHRHSPAAAM